jgi:hypothetical protein
MTKKSFAMPEVACRSNHAISWLASTCWLTWDRLGCCSAALAPNWSLCLVVSGVELALFHHTEFYVHVTDEVAFHFLPWFSNALLLTALAALMGSAVVPIGFRHP